jgi:hypothetical protein
MAISRKDALRKILSLVLAVEEHLESIAEEPESWAVPHWQGEVNNWLAQIEAMVPHVGKKTGAEWKARIEAWKARLGG